MLPTPSSCRFTLALSCHDRPGIVQAVSARLLAMGGNIVEAAQFGDADNGQFFMRVSFDVADDGRPAAARAASLAAAFSDVAAAHAMQWQLVPAQRKLRTLLLVSQLGHCLNDLLFRQRSGLLDLDIRGVVSNHGDFEALTRSYGLPFHHVPVTAASREAAEDRLLALVEDEAVDLVVLARYMQILSDRVCRRLPGRVVNIHHSFLPSFKGARPYHQARERGVKLIGATAHYVTADLDEGPIIEQSVIRVDHTMSAQALTAQGRDVECTVLARALQWHAQQRVFMTGSRTIVLR